VLPDNLAAVPLQLVVVGGGKMGEALLRGLFAARWSVPSSVGVVEKVEARRDELAAAHPGLQLFATVAQAGPADGVILAVKPGDVAAVCAELDAPRVLSIAAGVRIATIEAALAGDAAVVRAMPNTPALVGTGAAAIAPGTKAGEDDLVWAEGILGAVGIVERVPEALLDAVTGLSGSGPAYVFLVAEAMVEAGLFNGLPRDIAEQLTAQTILGAARLLLDSDDPAAVLRANVTSPGGTTAAGLRALESAGVRAAFIDAVTAATERSRELG
jgi:pyrroline-5-carboxylate reductase